MTNVVDIKHARKMKNKGKGNNTGREYHNTWAKVSVEPIPPVPDDMDYLEYLSLYDQHDMVLRNLPNIALKKFYAYTQRVMNFIPRQSEASEFNDPDLPFTYGGIIGEHDFATVMVPTSERLDMFLMLQYHGQLDKPEIDIGLSNFRIDMSLDVPLFHAFSPNALREFYDTIRTNEPVDISYNLDTGMILIKFTRYKKTWVSIRLFHPN